MNNREKLNQMNNEELSELLSNMPCSYCLASSYCHSSTFDDDGLDCDELIKVWLESEVER